MTIENFYFFLNTDRDLHHRDIIDIKQNPVKRNLQSENHVLVLGLVIGQIDMIINGSDEHQHQKQGSVVIRKISICIVVCNFFKSNCAVFFAKQ